MNIEIDAESLRAQRRAPTDNLPARIVLTGTASDGGTFTVRVPSEVFTDAAGTLIRAEVEAALTLAAGEADAFFGAVTDANATVAQAVADLRGAVRGRFKVTRDRTFSDFEDNEDAPAAGNGDEPTANSESSNAEVATEIVV